MDRNELSSMEIDAIGEILNISLGASATAVSTMLDARVDITTPVVNVKKREEFQFSNIEPAVGVEIVYISGLIGSNVLLLKKKDIKVIIEMLMNMEIPEDEFELDEMNISCVCEVMNQMMGASATALSELLGKSVNISTPVSFEVENQESFKDKYFTGDMPMVVVEFKLSISGKIESEFVNLIPIRLAKELVAGFFKDGVPEKEEIPVVQQSQSGGRMSQFENDALMSQNEDSVPQSDMGMSPQTDMGMPPQADMGMSTQQNAGMSAPDSQFMESMTQMMDMMKTQMELQQQQIQQMEKERDSRPQQIKVSPVPQPNLTAGGQTEDMQDANLDLIMGVPVDVSVEIGRTKKYVKDVLELNKGSLVVLDKLAGEQVDLFVNGRRIAQGDVVVVDDNFGIRITEILAEEIPLKE